MQELTCFSEFTILVAKKVSVMNTAIYDHVQPLLVSACRSTPLYSQVLKGRLLGHIQ